VTENSIELTVKVPGLSLLPSNGNYVKVGGTSKHFGPPGLQTDNNHYGTDYTISAIMSIAGLYKEEFQRRLLINDISLPYGGLFDINGDWQTPHKTHREGKNVDVDDKTAEGISVDRRWLRDKIGKEPFRGQFLNESNHYHLTFPR
jgi:hypothetical protein